MALSHLGHTSAAAGREQEAVGYLSQAAQNMRGASTAAISLVDMYRTLGQYEEALAQARLIAEAEPEEPMAALDVAELSLEVGNPDEAFTAFARLREIDDVPGHETYPLHGMIKAEIQREHWQHALELAQEAASGDAQGRTAGVIVFLRDQAGVPAEAEARGGAGRGAHARAGRRGAGRVAVGVPSLARRRSSSRRGGSPWLSPRQQAAPPPPSGFAARRARRSSTTSACGATSASARTATTTSGCASASASASCSTRTASRS